MFPFVCKLAKGIRLTETEDKYYLISGTPIRFLRINRSLYAVLKKILIDGYSLEEITSKKTQEDSRKIIEIILGMVSKRFLELEYDAEYRMENSCLPLISIVIPVRNRPLDIDDCLKSIEKLDYPQEKIEIIVVDDASTDHTVNVIRSHGVKPVCNIFPLGPGACRNLGVNKASGEIIAFLDSDCTVSSNWLQEIVPYFSLIGISAVGGFVAGFYKSSLVDRYEDSCSSLNMGLRIIYNNNAENGFYVPSCNLFVRREVFQEVKGFNPSMRVGEDVDLCWRLRDQGYNLLYTPFGTVHHKHRNKLLGMLTRRFEYGTSEADLYAHHLSKKKVLACSFNQTLSFLVIISAILTMSFIPLLLEGIILGADFYQKKRILFIFSDVFSSTNVFLSVLRSTFFSWYYYSFYLIRYYLLILLIFGFFYPFFYLGLISMILLTSSVDYFIKKPNLFFVKFLFIYLLEHLSYQCGVFYGCIKHNYYGILIPRMTLLKGN